MHLSNARLAAAFVGTVAITGSVFAQPDIGGVPIHSEEDYFSSNDLWGMTVWSYVFDTTTDLPEGFMLGEGEMLFAYLLDGDDVKPISIDTYSVGNPYLMPITSVGYSTVILPPGYDMALREDPYLFGYSGPAQATIFTYAGDFSDPYSTLDPDEWSLVWYIAEAADWDLGPATASGAGIGDNQFVPVPIPAPGVAAVLGLAAALGIHRRRD